MTGLHAEKKNLQSVLKGKDENMSTTGCKMLYLTLSFPSEIQTLLDFLSCNGQEC